MAERGKRLKKCVNELSLRTLQELGD